MRPSLKSSLTHKNTVAENKRASRTFVVEEGSPVQLELEHENSFDDGVMKVIPGTTSQDESQVFERADD